MDEARLRRELREAGQAHLPDHARMLARVERGLAAPSPSRATRARAPRPGGLARRWPAAVAVAAAVAGVVGLGGLAVTTLDGSRPAAPVAAAPAPTTPGPTAPGAHQPSAPGPSAQAVGTVDPGSNRWWAQSDLALTTTSEVSGLTVEIRVARTPGVVSTGHWHTRPAEDLTVTVVEEPGTLVYRWVLKPGRTVPPGPHTFAAQFNHAEGVRDGAADAYTVTLTGPDGGRSTLTGGFGSP
ncbi:MULTISPECIES: hypothetical protein [unclassified Streptomyces]|uniref:hypothetical protein n=1 Tax=unclassified Streptomyces TaxID=2593676 RepID=UPI0035DB1776